MRTQWGVSRGQGLADDRRHLRTFLNPFFSFILTLVSLGARVCTCVCVCVLELKVLHYGAGLSHARDILKSGITGRL